MARYRLDVAELYAALDQQRTRLGLSWVQVADRTGLASPVFSRLAAGRSVTADTAYTLLMWLAPHREVVLPFVKRVS